MQDLLNGNQLQKLLRKRNGELQRKYEIEKIDLQIIRQMRKGIDFNTLKALADVKMFDDDEIADSIKRLHKQGLIELVKDEKNIHFLGFRLTRLGTELKEKLEANYRYATDVLFKGMTQEQVDTFKRLARMVIENVDKEVNLQK